MRSAVGVATVATPLLIPGRAVAAASGGPTYYVSASGSDISDGLSPETSWATIQMANSALPGEPSTLLFRRGDTFYGELSPPFGCEVGAYGDGEKPVLTMFKLLDLPEAWSEDSPGVWKIDLSSPNSHDGYTSLADANIGYLMVDGLVKPAKKDQLAEVSAAWDFWCDTESKTLYVAASGNPTSLAASIKAAPRGLKGEIICCNQGSNDIHDLHLTGTGAHGIGDPEQTYIFTTV